MKKSLPGEWKATLPETQEDDVLRKALQQKFEEELRQKWAGQLAKEGIERNHTGNIVPLKRRRINYWAVAASLLVLLGATWWFFLKPSQPAAVQLADQYLVEIADQLAQTRKGEGGDDAWQTAQDLFAQQKFAEAQQAMESLAATKPLDAAQFYFLAFCQIQSDPLAYDAALASLEAARQANTAAGTDQYEQEIAWTKALLLLKKGDKATAVEELTRIQQANGWFAEKAGEVLKGVE